MGNKDATRIAKLPKWAQYRISQMSNQISTLEGKLNARVNYDGEILAYATDHVSGGFQGFRRHTVITYKMPNSRLLTIHHAGTRLEIHGSHTIAIEPQANNHFRVEVSG